MKAIEFFANAQDGIIKVPREYWKDLGPELRVIILVEEAASGVEEKKAVKRQLKAMSVSTKGFAFDRDEANER
jgi:hypothetical protein